MQCGVLMDSTWSLRGVSMESSWSPCRLFVDSTESSWTPWKPVGECKVLTHSFLLEISFGPISSSAYHPPPLPVYFPLHPSSHPENPHSRSTSPIPPQSSSDVDGPHHWTDQHLAVFQDLGLDPPPPFCPSKAAWLQQFILCSHWLHTSMPSCSPDEVYAGRCMD